MREQRTWEGDVTRGKRRAVGWVNGPLNTSDFIPRGEGGRGQGRRPEAPDCEVTELFKGSLWLLCGQDTDAPDRSRVNGARPRSSHLNALLSGAGSLSSRASPLSPTGISCLAWRTGALREKRRKKVLNNSGSNPTMNIFHQTH